MKRLIFILIVFVSVTCKGQVPGIGGMMKIFETIASTAEWVAVGEGTNSIAYSSNGINWTGIGKTIFSTRGFDAAWNGSMWVAVGSGTNTIAYSSDGINWTGIGETIFSTYGVGVESK